MISEHELAARIQSRPDQFGGQAYIVGAFVTVADVLQLLTRGVQTSEVLSRYPDMGHDDLLACLEFAKSKVEAAIETLHAGPPQGASKVDWKSLQSRYSVSDEFLDAAQQVFERHDEILRRLA